MNEAVETPAGDVFHRDVMHIAPLAHLVGPGQMRMRHALAHLHFTAESRQQAFLLPGLFRRQDLEGHHLLAAGVARR